MVAKDKPRTTIVMAQRVARRMRGVQRSGNALNGRLNSIADDAAGELALSSVPVLFGDSAGSTAAEGASDSASGE